MKESRFPQLTMEVLNDQQRPLAEKILTFSSIGLGGPHNTAISAQPGTARRS